MSNWKTGVLVGIVALAAAACSNEKPADVAGKGGPAVVEVPKRKPGLWKQTMLIEGIDELQSAQICLDEASDPKLAWWGQHGARQACRKNDIIRQPDGSWKFNSICEGGGVKTTNDGAAVGDFSSRYQLRSETTTTGSAMPRLNGTHIITVDAQWLGECPADMAPGDVDTPDGKRINMLEMMGMK